MLRALADVICLRDENESKVKFGAVSDRVAISGSVEVAGEEVWSVCIMLTKSVMELVSEGTRELLALAPSRASSPLRKDTIYSGT